MNRLLVHDDFPPSVVVRAWWDRASGDGVWKKIVHCVFCSSPYLMAISWAWAWASDLHWTWWAAHLFAGTTYLASILVAYDQPE